MTHQYLTTHSWIDFKLDLTHAPMKLWTLLGDACAKCEVIAGIPLRPETADEMHRVYLAKGVRATTAIEGNTLSESQVAQLERGQLELPPSKKYLAIEVNNILDACNEMLDDLKMGKTLALDAQRIKDLNRQVLNDLELLEDVVPGEIRTKSFGVGRYVGAPAAECELLLNKLCDWLNGSEFELGHLKLAPHVLKAIVSHLYIAWIHPFGDGNGRTARLIEHQLLMASGAPSPATHLLSNHYNETRTEYYRVLDLASKHPNGVIEFVVYALQGFVDGLTEQLERVKIQIWNDVWTNYVHSRFRDRSGIANARRRTLVLELSKSETPVRRRAIRNLSQELFEQYYGKTDKTITRDLNVLAGMDLITRTPTGVQARKDLLRAFVPVSVDS